MIRDRENKKWVAMMLPEHVQMLQQLDKELEKEEKPYVDEYTYTEWEEQIHFSMEILCPVQFKVWKDGHAQTVTGRVYYVNEHSRKYYVETAYGCEQISFDSIVGVEIYEGTNQ